jgi:hypothetical protein
MGVFITLPVAERSPIFCATFCCCFTVQRSLSDRLAVVVSAGDLCAHTFQFYCMGFCRHSLDALERCEEAHWNRVRARVLVEAPDPIGVAGAKDVFKQEVTPLLMRAPRPSEVTSSDVALFRAKCSPLIDAALFWHKYRADMRTWQQEYYKRVSKQDMARYGGGGGDAELCSSNDSMMLEDDDDDDLDAEH